MTAREPVRFRTVRPTDIPACAEIEKASYPEDEGASKTVLQYRQHHAARYFRCAVVGPEEEEEVIGFICSTRCREFTKESMSTHVPDGPLLAIHSVVVREEYRRLGIASHMLQDYVETIRNSSVEEIIPIQQIICMAKKELLTLYIHSGFSVIRPSNIVHGEDQWYELQIQLESKQGLPCYIVDAFADPDQAGTGNPAAVVIMEKDLDDESTIHWMQLVAAEFNLSETAFLLQLPQNGTMPDGDDADEIEEEQQQQNKEVHYAIRYFTPKVQVDLCGHATLASASILFQTLPNKRNTKPESIVFHAKQDIITTTCAPSARHFQRITMKLPAKPATPLENNNHVKTMLESALKVDPDSILYVGLSEGIGDLLVEIKTEDFLSIGYDDIQYDALLSSECYSRGVIVCCQSIKAEENNECETDFLCRFFAPKAGINEDPVTGSAFCVLAPYYSAKLEKQKVIGMQMSRRGGIVECAMEGDAVALTGTTVTAISGTLWL